jgi:hypothetical protein
MGLTSRKKSGKKIGGSKLIVPGQNVQTFNVSGNVNGQGTGQKLISPKK